jgi:hypothetical protein
MDALQPSVTTLLEELQTIVAANDRYLDQPTRSAEANDEYQRRIERLARLQEELKTLEWKAWLM